MNIYLVGSLREGGRLAEVAETLREDGHDVFDDWRACHQDADTVWRAYESAERGRSYAEAMAAPFVRHAFNFDLEHLNKADAVILVAKPGKISGFSAACELTWARCQFKRTFILLDGEPEHWEMMALLCVDPDDIVYSIEQLLLRL